MKLTLSPFLRGNVWWARVPRLDAAPVQRSLGVVGKEHRDVAQSMCDFLRWLKNRRESFLLDTLASGQVTISAAYSAFTDNRIEQFIRDTRDGLADVDLEPFVAKWQQELGRRKKPNADTRAKYLRQVRTLMPEGQPFRRLQFTKQRIRAWLAELTVAQPNRYRAALSSFAQFLVLEDVLPANPVRHVPMAREAAPRSLHLSMIIQCPDCSLKLRPKPPADTKPGTKVSVRCRCGTVLRFTMPDLSARGREIVERMMKIAEQMGDLGLGAKLRGEK